jgi:WD40 repeat protein
MLRSLRMSAAGFVHAWRRRRIAVFLSLVLLGSPSPATADIVYISNGFALNSVSEYDLNTGAAINANLVTGLSSAYGIAVDGNLLYAASRNTGIVGLYNATTGAAINAHFITGAGDIYGISLNGNGGLLVASYGGSKVGLYNANTGAVINANFINVSGPSNMALDGAGNLYVGSYSGTVGKYNAATGAAINANLFTASAGLEQIAIDSAGNLYTTSQFSGNVGKYNASTGATINANLVTGLPNLDGVAVDGSDLVLNYGVTGDSFIATYDSSTGDLIGTPFSTVGGNFIAVAVPEPSSLILMGLACTAVIIGGWFRLRRKPIAA